jgi:uncharacterized protein
MFQRDIASRSWGFQVLAFALCFLVCFAVFGILVLVLVPIISNIPTADFFTYTNYSDKAYMHDLILIQALYTIGIFGIPALLYGYFASTVPRQYLGICAPKFTQSFVLAVLAVVTSLGVVTLLGTWNAALPFGEALRAVEKKAELMTKAMLDIKTIPHLLLTLLYIALLPAIAEELFFRAALQRILVDALGAKRLWVAVLLTAVIFGVMHGQMLSAAPRIFLGIILGLIYLYSGSIWPGVVAHFVNNGLQVVLSYLHATGKISMDVNEIPNVLWWQVMISVVCCASCIWLLRRQSLLANSIA